MSRAVLRPAWSPRWVAWTGLALEASILLTVVALGAGGVFQGGDEGMPALPIRLGLRDAPALAVVAAFVALRGRLLERFRSRRRLPPFVPFCALATACAAAAHPEPGRGVASSAMAGLVVGLLIALVGLPMNAFAEELRGGEPRPWRELHAAMALVTLGTMSGAALGGVVVSLPSALLGVALLSRGLREDARDLGRAPSSRAAAGLRLVLGAAFLLLGVGLAAMTTALSLGLVRLRG